MGTLWDVSLTSIFVITFFITKLMTRLYPACLHWTISRGLWVTINDPLPKQLVKQFFVWVCCSLTLFIRLLLLTVSFIHSLQSKMPIHVIPVAIVTAKVCASAVVSLSPVAMRGDEEEGPEAAPQTSVRDLFKADFYKREFERLSSEAEPTTPPPPTTRTRRPTNRRSLLQSMRGLSMSSLASERSVPYATASSRRLQTAAAAPSSSSQSVASRDSDDSSQFSFSTIHVPEDEPWLASRESLRKSRQESLRSALHAWRNLINIWFDGDTYTILFRHNVMHRMIVGQQQQQHIYFLGRPQSNFLVRTSKQAGHDVARKARIRGGEPSRGSTQIDVLGAGLRKLTHMHTQRVLPLVGNFFSLLSVSSHLGIS